MNKLKAVFKLLFSHRWYLAYEKQSGLLGSRAAMCQHVRAYVIRDTLYLSYDRKTEAGHTFEMWEYDAHFKLEKELLKEMLGSKFTAEDEKQFDRMGEEFKNSMRPYSKDPISR